MKKRIMIIDDEITNLQVLSKLLQPLYTIHAFRSGEDFLATMSKIDTPDLILLDIKMPGLDGYETLVSIKRMETYASTPVIFITALDREIDEEKAFVLGASDYITKPFSPLIVKERIRVQLQLKEARDVLQQQNTYLEQEVNRRVQEIVLVQDVTTSVITDLVESRDAETGNHIMRTRFFIEALAKLISKHPHFYGDLDEDKIKLISQAAPLHDIGKIGIPDQILLKPGKLTDDEFTIMKTHCKIGNDAIEKALRVTAEKYRFDDFSQSTALRFLTIAKNLIHYHHERWNGKGYPMGLKEDQIPIEARLMSIVDVLDALISKRVYKKAWTFEETLEYFKEQAGQQFDPIMTRVLVNHFDLFIHIANEYQDAEDSHHA